MKHTRSEFEANQTLYAGAVVKKSAFVVHAGAVTPMHERNNKQKNLFSKIVAKLGKR